MKSFLTILFFCFGFTLVQAQDIMLLKSSGKVVIGDTSVISTPGNYNLYVQSGVLTERVKVSLKETTQWSDDAFTKTPSLNAMQKSIEENSHLLEMPSAVQLVKEGYELKSMDAKLLAQIEWLWQHMIEVSKENEALLKRIEKLEATK